jgi:alkyl sulfatase BDS1-like metallo-beta-lactamase superfamily hydrolase
VVFADPANQQARELQAQALEQLGYGCENATWRNFYLNGARELLGQMSRNATSSFSPEMLSALTIEQLFDSLAVRVDGPRAARTRLVIRLVIGDDPYTLLLANGVLTYIRGDAPGGEQPGATFTLTRKDFERLLSGGATIPSQVSVTGDPGLLATLTGLLDEPDLDFAIVTP